MVSINQVRYLFVVLLLAAAMGCASDAWNFDRYRDERAVDIECRLSRDEPIVKNPFGTAKPD